MTRRNMLTVTLLTTTMLGASSALAQAPSVTAVDTESETEIVVTAQ